MSLLNNSAFMPSLTHAGKAPFDPQTAQYVYVLIRGDLSPAQQGVQAVHAGMSATAAFGGLTEDTRLAMLSIDNEEELRHWMERLELKNIPFKAFWEPDRHTGFSALATAPISRNQGRLFARLPMWDPLRCVDPLERPFLEDAAIV